ncbi:tetratricopeptide repeat protein [Streptomyces sp. NPDC059853]|uniref:tetratricopeptide repeat protein n=1 Tax=Streptomyces sp. NPDC059853 TaxID=3346973 RepID=UPI00365C9693
MSEHVSRTVTDLVAAGIERFAGGAPRAAYDLFDRAARAAEPYPALADQYLQALINRAAAAGHLGDHPAAIATFENVLARCAAEPERLGPLRPAVLINLAQSLLATGAFEAAERALTDCRALLTGTGDDDGGDDGDSAEPLMAALVALSTVAIQREDWERAERLTRAALETVTRLRPDLVGRTLMNVATVALATGRHGPAEDLAEAALAACEAGGEQAGACDVRLMLAQLMAATGRPERAEALLHTVLAHTGPAGLTERTSHALELLGTLAGARGEPARAEELYARAHALLEPSGATPALAVLAVRRGEAAWRAGRPGEADGLLTRAADTFAALGLGLRRAQTHLVHAALLEHSGSPRDLARALDLAVPAALTVDAVRYGLTAGRRRERWRRGVAEPALALAFRLAARTRDARLVAQLIEVQCATTPVLRADGPAPSPGLRPGGAPAAESAPSGFLEEPPPSPDGGLAAALAGAEAAAVLPVAPPPRLLYTPEGEVALADRIALAEERYGMPVRDTRQVPSW